MGVKTNYTFKNGNTVMRVKPHWKETLAACDELFDGDNTELFIEDDRMQKVVDEMSEVRRDLLQFNHNDHEIAINFGHRKGKGNRTLGMKSYEEKFYKKRKEEEEKRLRYQNMAQYAFGTGYIVEFFVNEDLYKERIEEHDTSVREYPYHGSVEGATEEILAPVIDKMRGTDKYPNYDKQHDGGKMPGLQSNSTVETAREAFDTLVSFAKKDRAFPEISHCIIYNNTINQ